MNLYRSALLFLGVSLFSFSAWSGNVDFLTSYDSTACAASNSKIKCWGFTTGDMMDPHQMEGLKLLSTADFHGCGVDRNGLKCWGLDGDSRIQIPSDLKNITALNTGGFAACVQADKRLRCWGDSRLSVNGLDVSLPQKIQMLTLPFDHVCVLADQKVKCWGSNEFGKISFPAALKHPREIAAGAQHTCVLDDNGVTCVGYEKAKPDQAPKGLKNMRSLVAGSFNSCVIHDGGVKCWGDHQDILDNPKLSGTPDRIVMGDEHGCALIQGKVECWGRDFLGVISEVPPEFK